MRMKLRLLAIVALFSFATPLAAQGAPDEPTVAVEIGDDGIVVDRPSLWKVGLDRKSVV